MQLHLMVNLSKVCGVIVCACVCQGDGGGGGGRGGGARKVSMNLKIDGNGY